MENKKKNKTKSLINIVLENEIFRLLNEAESMLNLNPEEGKNLLRFANGLYNWRGYCFAVEKRINEVFFLYMTRDL